MNQRKKMYEINFDNENMVRYVGTIEVMSSSRTGGGPTVRLHVDMVAYNLLEKKKVVLNKLLKKQPCYKKLGNFSTRSEGTIPITISNDSHIPLMHTLKDSVLNMDPIVFEIKIEPILQEIKKEYDVQQKTYAFS